MTLLVLNNWALIYSSRYEVCPDKYFTKIVVNVLLEVPGKASLMIFMEKEEKYQNFLVGKRIG